LFVDVLANQFNPPTTATDGQYRSKKKMALIPKPFAVAVVRDGYAGHTACLYLTLEREQVICYHVSGWFRAGVTAQTTDSAIAQMAKRCIEVIPN
jgi:hypothetical protein